MSVIFATSSAANVIGSATTYTGSPISRDAAYTDTEIRVNHLSNVTDEFFQIPSLACATGTLWLHFRGNFPTDSDSTAADGSFIVFRDGDGDPLAAIDVQDGNLRASAYSSTTGQVYGASWSHTPNTTYTFDIGVTWSGATTTVQLFVDGILVSEASGGYATHNGDIDQIDFSPNDFMGVTATSGYGYYSELIVDDAQSTLGCRLNELKPASDGTHLDFTGDYTALTTDDDGNVLVGNNGDLFSWNPTAYGGPNGGETIRALVGVARGLTGASGPTGFSQSVRFGGTDYFGGSTTLGASTVGPSFAAWGQNPNTLADWTIADLASVEFGLRADA